MLQALVVDAANVVGSVPNGWWRDRAGAARRLVDDLSRDPGPGGRWDLIVVVLEGAARAGVPASVPGTGIQVVHAPGCGDDELVARCRELVAAGYAVTLGTADRGLRARVRPLGVAVIGPRSLRPGQ